MDVAVDANGNISVLDIGFPAIFNVDPLTGNRTIISGHGVGSGTILTNVKKIVAVPAAAVPEPSTLLLAAIALLGLLAHGNRRRRT